MRLKFGPWFTFVIQFTIALKSGLDALLGTNTKRLNANGRIQPRLLFCDRQNRIYQVDRISADHDLECAGLDDLVHVAIQE